MNIFIDEQGKLYGNIFENNEDLIFMMFCRVTEI